jgi:hypothetical protein
MQCGDRDVRAALIAGSTFATGVLGGFVIGLLVSKQVGQPLWAVVGLLAGALFGGYTAIRLLLQAGK